MSSPDPVDKADRLAAGLSELRGIPYLRLFPWLRLFRAVGVAADSKCLLLAALGLILLHGGAWGLDRVFPKHREFGPLQYYEPGPPANPPMLLPRPVPWPLPVLNVIIFRGRPADNDFYWSSLPKRLIEPAWDLVGPFLVLFSPEADGKTFGHAFLLGVWGVMVWGPIGGAIARIALTRIVRSEPTSLVGALRYALKRWVALIVAPLSPLLGVAFFAAGCALFGLLYRIPGGVGATIAGALSFLPLLAGLLMTLIVIGLALGWPLMPATVAAEGEDGFDALSRSYAYVNQRRWRYGLFVGMAWLIGCVGLIFVDVFTWTVIQMTHWALSFSAPRDTLAGLYNPEATAVGSTAATLHTIWLSFVGLLAYGWIYSYFFTSASIIYLILRHDVDGTPFHVLHRDEDKGPRPASVEPEPQAQAPAPVADPEPPQAVTDRAE